MGAPFPESDITNWETYDTNGWNAVFGAGSMLVQAGNINQWDAARNSVAEAGSRLENACHNMIGPPFVTNAQYYLYDILLKIYQYWPSGGTVDMDAILNAMLAAKFDQLQKFIGIEQAYMAAIWNAPFNADFYAALARGWRQWP